MKVQHLGLQEWPEDVEKWHLSPIVKVGDMVFISGVNVQEHITDREAHLVAAFETVADTLMVVGLGWEHVVKLTTYHAHGFREHLDLVRVVKDRFVKPPYPAWTGVGVEELANPDALIEIDVVAVAADGET